MPSPCWPAPVLVPAEATHNNGRSDNDNSAKSTSYTDNRYEDLENIIVVHQAARPLSSCCCCCCKAVPPANASAFCAQL